MQLGDSPAPVFVTLTQRKQSQPSKASSDPLESQSSSSMGDRSASNAYHCLYPQMSGLMPPPNLAFFPGTHFKRMIMPSDGKLIFLKQDPCPL